MKPQDKTVTLIGLDGNPICRYVEGKTEIYYVAPHKGVYDGCLVVEPTGVNSYGEKHTLKPLMEFLQDQLTFIRNGMWETLAIYQATLGRYTEVPWYDPKVLEPKHEQNYNVRALDEYDLSKGYFDQEYTDLEGCQYCANAKEFTWAMFVHEHLVIGLDENVPQEITAMAIQPMLEDFIKYYPDVFSKLTPLEGK